MVCPESHGMGPSLTNQMEKQTPRRLIVTADDVGLHRGMTTGAIKAHHDGIVTACSVVANGRELQHAVEILRDTPSIDVGIHLALVEERPVADPKRIPSLLSHDRFRKSYRQFAMAYFAGRIKISEIEIELRAQIETLLAAGLRLVHVNGHQHLHLLPRIFDTVVSLAQEYKIPYLRVARDSFVHASTMRGLSIGGLNHFGRKAKKRTPSSLLQPDRTIGIADAGHFTTGQLVPLFDFIDGLTELVCHPGIGDAEIRKSYKWGYAWDEETRALCDRGVRMALGDRGVELVSIRDLARKATAR